jgi:GDP-mannose transporter
MRRIMLLLLPPPPPPPDQVWGSLCLMLGSAVVGASTDARFSWPGYTWQAINCMFTSAYALFLRAVMDKVGEVGGWVF